MASVILLIMGSILLQWKGTQFVKALRPSGAERLLKENESVTVVGTVMRAEQKEKNQVLYLKDNSITYQGKKFYESKLIVYDSKFTQYQIGNILSVSGKAGFFQRALNPGNFDQKQYYQRQDIHVKIFADKIAVKNKSKDMGAEWLRAFRKRVSQYYMEALGAQYGGVVSAMLLGEKNLLDPELKEVYQKNGIGHILAISGLHISFLGAGLYSLVRKVGGSYLTAGIIGAVFLLLYVLMIGMGISAQRALIMFLIRIGADITGRVYDMATAIAVSAAVIFITQPLCIYDAGFLLSFGAVTGIVTVCPAIEKWLPEGTGKLGKAAASSIGIQIAMYPLLLYYFFEVPLYAVFLNLIVIPSMSWILFAAVIGGGTSFLFYAPALFFLKHLKVILGLYEILCKCAQNLPFARIILGKPSIWQIGLYYAVLGVLVVIGGQEERFRFCKRKICTVCTAILCLSCLPIYRQNGNLQVIMLDIGQGDSIFLQNPGGMNCLIDGGSSDVKNVGQYRIEPFLKSQGIGTLDYVFLSHGDADHMNGIEEMIGRQELGIKIACLVFPDVSVWDEKITGIGKKARAAGIQTVIITEGQGIADGKLDIKCIQPGGKSELKKGNEASMVLEVSYQEFDMLFTGDTEGMGEEELTQKINHSYDVLKAAHHGSKNSSAEEFLQKVQPTYTFISAGEHNRYGHPHSETLQRMQETATKIYQTVGGGAAAVETDGSKMAVKYIMK